MRFKQFLIYFFLGISWAQAQGLVFDDEAYESHPRQAIFGAGQKAEIDILKSVSKKSLKKYCPKVEHQGWVSSCVGWATGYGALTIQRALEQGWTGKDKISEYAYSALFIFNQIKITDCGFGARLGDAMQLLIDKGNVLSNYYDTDKENCHKAITPVDLDLAKDHRIKDYVTLFGSKDDKQLKVNKTKLSLIQDMPVVIGMSLLNNFTRIPYRDSIWYPDIGDQGVYGGHAMVVIGFDDGLGAFEIQNSWGETWANHGFVWVKYEDYAEYVKYGFQMYLDKGTKYSKTHSLGAKLKKKVAQLTNGEILFKELVPRFNGEYYELDAPLSLGSIVQIKVDGISQGGYVYALSLDPQNKIKVHWPRDQELDKEYTGKHESARIHIANTELTFPTEESAFVFNKPGKDYIMILYSTNPLKHINELIDSIMSMNAHPIESLYQVFGQNVLRPSEINFQGLGIGFKVGLEDNRIIPVVLEVEVQQ